MKKFLIPSILLLGFVFASSITPSNPSLISKSVKLGLLSSVAKTCVDPNTASFDELQSIKHIGIDEAISILKLRNIIEFSPARDINYVSGLNENELGELKNELCYTETK